MKVCVIGDVHGTTKFLDCYEKIKSQDNDCQKIIVCGDWFDPYEPISIDKMTERFHQFKEYLHTDDRIINLLGNHDLESYIICGETNRTARSWRNHQTISREITSIIPDSYLIYKIGNWLFSHAGVSQAWLDRMSKYSSELLSNKKGWSVSDLDTLCCWYYGDYSKYGNCIYQGCTWIRPDALIKSLPDKYNQVVGHSQVYEICNLKDECPDGSVKNDVWLVDNQRKPEYLTLNIEESE